jgi:hypothetical protein
VAATWPVTDSLLLDRVQQGAGRCKPAAACIALHCTFGTVALASVQWPAAPVSGGWQLIGAGCLLRPSANHHQPVGSLPATNHRVVLVPSADPTSPAGVSSALAAFALLMAAAAPVKGAHHAAEAQGLCASGR